MEVHTKRSAVGKFFKTLKGMGYEADTKRIRNRKKADTRVSIKDTAPNPVNFSPNGPP